MTWRSRCWIAATLATALSASTPPKSQAGFYTEQATVDVHTSSPTTLPPITTVIQAVNGSGRTFTNTYGSAVIDGSTSALVRSVGVLVINDVDLKNSAVDSGVLGPGVGTQRLVVAFALDGHTIVTASGAPTVEFTSGGAGIWQAPNVFIKDDATQWFNNFTQPVYQTQIAPQTNVFVGNGDTLGGLSPGSLAFAAADTNLSAQNLATSNLLQGTLLFNETSDPGTNSLAYALMGGTQTGFLNTTTNFQSANGITGATIDSLLAISNQTVGSQSDANALLNGNTSGGGTATAKQAVVNELAKFFGLSLLTNGAFEGYFATFGSGGAMDYLPASGPVFGTNGDFSSTASVELYPGLAAVPVPEPASIALWALGSVMTGLFARSHARQALRHGPRLV